MTQLIIAPHTMGLVLGTGCEVEIRALILEHEGKLENIYGTGNLGTHEEVDLCRYFGGWSVPIRLELRVRKLLGSFLSDCHDKDHDLDCYDFVCDAWGIERNDKTYLLRFWSFLPWWRQKRVGDAVFLINKEGLRFRHAALYLGQDLYLSVFGKSGDLVVTTLKQMKKAFEAKNVVVVQPRKL